MTFFEPCQKHKLLMLQKILLEKTDDKHDMTVNEIIKELNSFEIKAERKTVYDDIATLISFGMDIVVSKRCHSNAYYVGNRIFQEEELQLLADAVASSKFLTTKKSNELITKLQGFTSKFNAQQLRRNIYIENRVKTFNESIYYNINAIHDAIFEKKKIEFKYFEYTLEKKKQHKNGGAVYTINPYYLIWESDYYYLVCYCEKHETICRYRVDRITDIKITTQKIRALVDSEADVAKNLRSTYSMFGGVKETVTLELDNDLISVIIDRYGDKVNIKAKDSTTFIARIEVQISPPFWGWLFQFGVKAKVIAPQNVVIQAKECLRKLNDVYK